MGDNMGDRHFCYKSACHPEAKSACHLFFIKKVSTHLLTVLTKKCYIIHITNKTNGTEAEVPSQKERKESCNDGYRKADVSDNKKKEGLHYVKTGYFYT